MSMLVFGYDLGGDDPCATMNYTQQDNGGRTDYSLINMVHSECFIGDCTSVA
jgi:hypothetical protein